MTVRELIKVLENYDPDMGVVVRGYEGGYSDIEDPFDVVKVVLNYHTDWYYGPHENVTNLYLESQKHLLDKAVEAIVID